MTATYRFKLPEDTAEHKVFSRAQDMSAAIDDFARFLRQETKYATEVTPDVILAERNRLQEEFWRILGEYNLDPYDL